MLFDFFREFFKTFQIYFFAVNPVFSTGVAVFWRKEKNKSEKSDKKVLTLLKNRL